MMGEMVLEWKMVVYPLMAVMYLVLVGYLEKRFCRRRPLTDEECLSRMAKMRESSEYLLFHQCGGEWSLSRPQVERDFRAYLMHGTMPYYVRDFVRKNRKAAEESVRSSPSVQGAPPSWFA